MAIKGELFKSRVKVCDVAITRVVEAVGRFGKVPTGGGKPVGLVRAPADPGKFTLVGPASLAGIAAERATSYTLAPIGKVPLPILIESDAVLPTTPPTVEVTGTFA